MVTNICADDQRVVFKKLKYSYKFFCTECGEVWTGDKDEKNAMAKTHLCTKCFSHIKTSEQNKEVYTKDILEENEGYRYWYRIYDSKVHLIKKEQVYKVEGNKQYRRNYHIYYVMGKYSFSITPDYEPDNKWKITRSQNWEYAFYNYKMMIHRHQSKKRFLMTEFPLDMKSNQRYMVMNNHLNKEMMLAIKEFDIKDIKLCYRYSGWINKNFANMWETHNLGLNETDLKYCVKNKIWLSDYCDYIRTCKECGIKNKHPKNFKEADAELNKLKEIKKAEIKQKEIGKKLLKRFKSLPSAISKTLEIHPYKDCMELASDAENFHICIYRLYTDKYANGETDLYRCVEGDKLVACIEVKDNKIIQVRGKFNAVPEHEKQIEKMIKKSILQKGDGCTNHSMTSMRMAN